MHIKFKLLRLNSLRFRAGILFLSVLMTPLSTFGITSYAHTIEESIYLSGTWTRDAVGWRFFNQYNASYPAGQWAEYEGYSYYFMQNGYLATGWDTYQGHWYYFNKDTGKTEGAMEKGWIFDPNYNGWFYTNDLGIMITGWHKIEGFWYYFNQSSDGVLGLMATNTVIDGSYVDPNGIMNEER
ncbi:glucan-binding protein [Clostridium sp. E02]|uniref:glucan-binding protein n=1 Tax=Clostridium sp. E02 TaxID=2487134 RepID=UPI000F52552D|nr:glucan-binding protein [Clostridium sp. E02]